MTARLCPPLRVDLGVAGSGVRDRNDKNFFWNAV